MIDLATIDSAKQLLAAYVQRHDANFYSYDVARNRPDRFAKDVLNNLGTALNHARTHMLHGRAEAEHLPAISAQDMLVALHKVSSNMATELETSYRPTIPATIQAAITDLRALADGINHIPTDIAQGDPNSPALNTRMEQMMYRFAHDIYPQVVEHERFSVSDQHKAAYAASLGLLLTTGALASLAAPLGVIALAAGVISGGFAAFGLKHQADDKIQSGMRENNFALHHNDVAQAALVQNEANRTLFERDGAHVPDWAR